MIGPFALEGAPAEPAILIVEAGRNAGEADLRHACRLHSVARAHAAEDEGLLHVPHVEQPLPRSRRLLRAVGQHVIDLIGGEPHQRRCRCRCAESGSDAVIGEASEVEIARADRLGQPACDFVPCNHRAHEVCPAAPVQACSLDGGGNDGGAGLDIGRRDEIVDLGRVRGHPGGEDRIHRRGCLPRTQDGAGTLRRHGLCIAAAQLRRLERVARDDGGQRVENVETRAFPDPRRYAVFARACNIARQCRRNLAPARSVCRSPRTLRSLSCSQCWGRNRQRARDRSRLDKPAPCHASA